MKVDSVSSREHLPDAEMTTWIGICYVRRVMKKSKKTNKGEKEEGSF
jgi:hypothetical protein